MRKTILTLVSAAALAVPLITFTGTAANAAGGTSCSTATGKATFNPALPKVGSPNKVLATITVAGKSGGCTGGGVKSNNANGTFKFSKAGNCQTLASGSGGASNGTLTLKWNNGQTSTVTATIKQVSGHATEATVSGVVSKGLFKGLHASETVTFTLSSAGGDCVHNDLHYVTYAQQSKLVIK